MANHKTIRTNRVGNGMGWMDVLKANSIILKSGKAHLLELDRMLRGIDKKFFRGDIYFPRNESDDFYNGLWEEIKRSMKSYGDGKTVKVKRRYSVIEDRKLKEYTLRINARPLLADATLAEQITWGGALVKPEIIPENWAGGQGDITRFRNLNNQIEEAKNKQASKEYIIELEEERHKFLTENFMARKPKIARGIGVKGDDKRVVPIFSPSNMKNRLESMGLDISDVSNFVNEEKWKEAHTGHFILMLYKDGRKIINIQLRLNVGYKPPPTNPYYYEKVAQQRGGWNKIDRETFRKWQEAQAAWIRYWKEYDAYMESEDAETQVKIQDALDKVFDIIGD